ncbi:hypothetical protein VNO80_12974 [Phaseolus coccineus]|uniref:CTP synthase N-terminal domain-containing protein n=1 Tax=Phaseolus coccineus TaxID=3886 RepID=A0AAN9N626_PHACN
MKCTLRCSEKTNLVKQLSVVGFEGDEEVEVSIGLDEGIADLRGDDETVLFHVGDASGFLDGGRREAFIDEEGDEGRVLVPKRGQGGYSQTTKKWDCEIRACFFCQFLQFLLLRTTTQAYLELGIVALCFSLELAHPCIQEWIERVAKIQVDGKEGPSDVYVIELGGTIGDIESILLLKHLASFHIVLVLKWDF